MEEKSTTAYDAGNETLIIISPILRKTDFHEFHCLSAKVECMQENNPSYFLLQNRLL